MDTDPNKKIGRVVTGKTPPTNNPANYGEGYMFVTPVELHDNFIISQAAKTITEQGLSTVRTNALNGFSILVGCIGWDMGNVALVDCPCVTNQQINSITDIKDAYNPYYIYYWLTLQKQMLFKIANVTRTPILNKTTFEDVLVPIPDRTVQDAVVSVLLPISRKIALNNRINAELERTARTVYEYMFLQGERSNWKTEKLNSTNLCSLISTGVDSFDGEKIYLSTSEVNGVEITDHTITVDYDNRPSRANMQPKMHSVWFAKMKNTVKHLLVHESNAVLTSDYLLSTGFAGFKCKPHTLYYLWNYFCGDYFELQKDTLATGATQQAINDTDLASFSILVPPQAELEKFAKIVEPYYRLINRLKFENKALAEHRDFLLPLLMNGQVTVAADKA